MSLEDLKKRLDATENPTDIIPVGGGLQTYKRRMFKVSTNDLREAIEANPDHKVAKVYKDAIAHLKGNKVVRIERMDLEALIKNLDVECLSSVDEDGVEVITKHLKQPKAPRLAPGKLPERMQRFRKSPKAEEVKSPAEELPTEETKEG
jgi:hypothetical protein